MNVKHLPPGQVGVEHQILKGYTDTLAHLIGLAHHVEARDLRDRTRAEAPLVAAADAVLLDTSDMARDEAIAAAIRIAERTQR